MMSLLIVDVHHFTAQLAPANVATTVGLVEIDLEGGK